MTDVIEKFYKAFSDLDAETMVSCYHDDITFKDPAFGTLKGHHAKNMWLMLCSSQKENTDFRIEYSNISGNEQKAYAHWEAHYHFSKTGRKVHNKIDAEFTFKDGKIITHTDTFNLHKWATQAMGFKGRILGRTKYFKQKLQTQTNRLLSKFEEKSK